VTLPLTGVVVVALEQAVSAPFATRQLADMGARVIKVERVGEGDFARHYDTEVRGMACHFVWVNRGKESLAVDFKHPAGRAVLDELIASADVVVQNLAPGTADGLGLSARQLTARHPWLIGCRFPRRYPRAGKRGWTGSRAWATILARSSWRLAATMARSAG
jgi:itaconate CoA-transferase